MADVGTRLGPYEIVARIGAGGMGEVYRARDSRLGRDVAIKVLPDRLAQDPEALARFEREIRAVAALSHPNILALFDIGKHQDRVFAVTELLEGETLRSRIERAPLAWRKALELAVPIVEGIAAAHAKGIIHRDLKLDNLFLTSDGRIKILDFGLARIATHLTSQMETATFPPGQTDPGTIMGTAGYMAPEQVRGLPVDPRCDLFAFGCVLYEMVTGQRAFDRGTSAETMTAILHDEPPDLADSGQMVPPEIDRVIRHCLEKNPEERYQSARDLAFALRAILTGSDSGKTTPQPRVRGRAPARRTTPPPRRSRAIESLAVLPFSNASSDQNAEYLSDGITESLIYSLSQLPKLRVMARSTVFRYKGKEADPQEIGRTLGVRAVLSGRVLLLGNRLVIKTELVDVADGALLWGEQYSRPLADILAIQEEISQEITAKLRLRLTGADKKKLAKRATENTQAYQLYLKGRFHWNKRTEESFRRAIEYFMAAIARDPAYALAHAGLADGYNMLGAYGLVTPLECYPRAESAAGKALEIDDTLAEAHTSLAWSKLAFGWDWPGAEHEFQRALALNPCYATAQHWYAYLLINLGRLDEAAERMRAAQELDPLSPIITANVGYRHFFAGQFDQAAEQFHKALEIDPHFGVAHSYLGRLAEHQGRLEDAIISLQWAIAFSGADSEFVACLGHAYAVAGQGDEARKILADLELAGRRRYVPAFHFALVHTGLGESDQAFRWLDRAYAERDGFLIYLKIDYRLDPLRPDPRFVDLYGRVGLPVIA